MTFSILWNSARRILELICLSTSPPINNKVLAIVTSSYYAHDVKVWTCRTYYVKYNIHFFLPTQILEKLPGELWYSPLFSKRPHEKGLRNNRSNRNGLW